MSRNLDGMVVAASGIPEMVARWSLLLRRAKIQFAVAQSLHEDGQITRGHLEIWVESDDADGARDVLIKAEKGNRALLW